VPSFGVAAGDLDLDGWQDLVITGGAPVGVLARWQVGLSVTSPTRFYWRVPTPTDASSPSTGTDFARFELLDSEQLGTDALAPLPGRAALLADIDGDGDLDALLTGSRGTPLLLTSELDHGSSHVRIRLAGRPPNTHGLGARIELTAGGHTQHREVHLSGGYLAQDELTQTFGLGRATTIDRLAIHWPDGHVQLVDDPAPNRLHIIEE